MESWTKEKVHTVKHFRGMELGQNTISRGFRKELEPKESLDLEDRPLNCLLNEPIR